jgi:hypothetical protein
VRARSGSNGWWALACLAACATGCLPVGDPPSGRQVTSRRTDVLVGVVPVTPPDDGVLRLLVARPRDDGAGSDLIVVSDHGGSAPASETTLLERWDSTYNVCGFRQCRIPSDSRGRLLVNSSDPVGGTFRYTRVDPVTGERLDLGERRYALLSPSGDRLVTLHSDGAEHIELYEIDDRKLTLPGKYGSFVGEDFVFVDDAERLQRVRPQGAPEVVKEGVESFAIASTSPDSTVLMLFLSGGAPNGASAQSLFDVATSEEHPLPFAPDRHWLSASADGRWAYGQSFGAAPFFLFDVANGTEEAFATPEYSFEAEWRPGHAEIWFVSADQQDVGWIKRPGQPLVELPVRPGSFTDVDHVIGSATWFTADGDYWFSRGTSKVSGGWSVAVGDADDPAGPRFPVNPDGSKASWYRRRADGTLLVEWHYTLYERADLAAVDPATGASRLLGQQGQLLIAGERRGLAMLRWLDGAADLAVIDLDTGAQTKLAEDYAVIAHAERRGPDPLAAGTRVVFQFHNRFPSPYDGIWVTTLP